MRFDSLQAWLAWQETLNPRGIELGLDRVRRVCGALGLRQPPFRVLTVGGTNGKGSVTAYAAAMLQAGGFRVGRYLSPHIRRYNERIAIDGIEAGDAELCAAFDAVDRARGEEPLTYFEFGTLAALEVFRQRRVDVAVLEVGLGGRLDAVNVLDADVAVVASVGLDHMDWLGHDIDGIAREKAGIFRAERPAFFGEPTVPAGLLREADRIGARLAAYGKDFECIRHDGAWDWRSEARCVENLPPPLPGAHQYLNAATALAAVLALEPGLADEALRAGIGGTRLPGRLESLGGAPEFVIDVGHNPDAAACIAQYLRDNPKPTQAVLGMLVDKDVPGFVRELVPLVEQWHLAGLPGARGQTAAGLADRLALAKLDVPLDLHNDVSAAVRHAAGQAPASGRVLILGSFHTVEAFLVYFEEAGGSDA